MRKGKKSIKYILWDIDGTLLDFELTENKAIRECFKDFNFGNCSDKQLEDYKKINNKYWKRLENGEISKKEVLEGRFVEFFLKNGIDSDIASEFNEAYQICIGNIAYYMKNAKETVLALKRLEKLGLDKLLDDVFISERMGFEKPSINYYETVFEKVGSHNLEEYIMIGDSLTSDMQGGINAGITTCWFNANKKENDKKLNIDYEINDLKEVIDILSYRENPFLFL